jgi:hypothetical protein
MDGGSELRVGFFFLWPTNVATTTRRSNMAVTAIHPGQHLAEEFKSAGHERGGTGAEP